MTERPDAPDLELVGVPPGSTPASTRLLFVASTGGHLAQLAVLRPWWEQFERRWVTFNNRHAIDELAGEHVTWAYWPTTRNAPNAVRNLWLARRVLTTYRPDVVISTGAGVAVPFFLLARLKGIRTMYIEVVDRISSRTLTGRLVYGLTDAFAVQWEEQLALYPDAHVVGPLL